MNEPLMFIYNGKLRIVTAIAIKRGRFGQGQLVARNRLGKIRTFNLDEIVPLTMEQQDVLDGETVLA